MGWCRLGRGRLAYQTGGRHDWGRVCEHRRVRLPGVRERQVFGLWRRERCFKHWQSVSRPDELPPRPTRAAVAAVAFAPLSPAAAPRAHRVGVRPRHRRRRRGHVRLRLLVLRPGAPAAQPAERAAGADAAAAAPAAAAARAALRLRRDHGRAQARGRLGQLHSDGAERRRLRRRPF